MNMLIVEVNYNIYYNGERLVANSLTPPFAFGKQTSDSKISGNSKVTSWTSWMKVFNHTT